MIYLSFSSLFFFVGCFNVDPLYTKTRYLLILSIVCLQQQMHAQQIPITPPHPIPTLAGPLGAFAGPMGLPHNPQALLKVPQELHRDDNKVPLGGTSADERLVCVHMFSMKFSKFHFILFIISCFIIVIICYSF